MTPICMEEPIFVDPFAFFDTYPIGQSVAVVGNSGSLAGWKMGPEIERHNVIVRFNECRVRKFIVQVGERTDLLVTNPYVEKREKTVGSEVQPKMAMVIFSHQRRGSQEALLDWLNGTPALATFAPRLLKVPEVPPTLSISSGTYGIYLLNRLLHPSSMLITGFSMFNDRYKPYYWSDNMPPGVAKHDFPREATVFANLLNSFTHRIHVTPEIVEVFQSAGIEMGNHIRVVTPAPIECED